MLEQLNIAQPLPLAVDVIIFNIFVGAILALIIKIHFKKFSSTLTNKNQFSNIFPIILLTTLLVIFIVKSSLALSLGLVGALSIVRFRTPIKEPEELGYLFLTIGAGLGLGANQTIPTVSAVIGILIIISLFKINLFKNVSDNKEKNIFLNLEYIAKSKKQKDLLIQGVNEIIKKNSIESDLRRLDVKGPSIDLAFLVSLENINSLQVIIRNLEKNYPNITINYIDQKQLPSI
jgi:hypothetical protein